MCQITSTLTRNRNVFLAVQANGNAAMKHHAAKVYRNAIETAKNAGKITTLRYQSLLNEAKGSAS